VSLADTFGNTVSNLGAALTVTVGHSGGTVSPNTLTIPASGSAQSSGSLSWSEGTGNYNDTVTLSASPYGSVQANLNH
jgi:hypothetical protein